MTPLAVVDRGGPGALADAAAQFRVQPHNVEAEQAVLGAVLVNNEAFHRVGEFLRPEHFHEPVREQHAGSPSRARGAVRPRSAPRASRGSRSAAGAQRPPPPRVRASTSRIVVPSSAGVGAIVTPASRRISTFSGALSPKAEMIAPAWPILRPLGALRPAT
jgi:hypothetical protein